MSFRRVSVYFLAVFIGVGAAFLLLPRGIEAPSNLSDDKPIPPSVEANSPDLGSEVVKKKMAPEVAVESVKKAKERGVGGNPKANLIREALSSPEHAFLAKTSPIWVQIRRVLTQFDEPDWIDKVNVLLEDISDGRRTINLEGEVLLSRQNAMLESLWNSDFPMALTNALREPLEILGGRIEAYEN
jgi:hypothetical protein